MKKSILIAIALLAFPSLAELLQAHKKQVVEFTNEWPETVAAIRFSDEPKIVSATRKNLLDSVARSKAFLKKPFITQEPKCKDPVLKIDQHLEQLKTFVKSAKTISEDLMVPLLNVVNSSGALIDCTGSQSELEEWS